MSDAGRKKAAADAFSAVLVRASGFEKQALTRWDDWWSAGTPAYKKQLLAENRAQYRQQNAPAQPVAAARAAQPNSWWASVAPYMKYIVPGALGGLLMGDSKTPWWQRLLTGGLLAGLGGYGYKNWISPYLARTQKETSFGGGRTTGGGAGGSWGTRQTAPTGGGSTGGGARGAAPAARPVQTAQAAPPEVYGESAYGSSVAPPI